MIYWYFCNLQKYSHHSEKKTMETRIIKKIFNKNEERCRDVKTPKACEQGREANIGPKIKQTTSIKPYISTALCILLYSSVSTYVGFPTYDLVRMLFGF